MDVTVLDVFFFSIYLYIYTSDYVWECINILVRLRNIERIYFFLPFTAICDAGPHNPTIIEIQKIKW